MPEYSQQLEARHAQASIHAAPQSTTLRFRVPPAFQAYLIRRKQLAWLFALGILVLVTVSFFWPHLFKHRPDPTFYLEFLSYTMVYLLWREQAKKPWYYDLGPIDAKLIALGKTDWAWHHMKWQKNNYVAVERNTWKGLPMLVVTRRSSYFWEPKKLLLVYSPDDEALVNEQVLPFMAKRGTLVNEGAWYQKK